MTQNINKHDILTKITPIIEQVVNNLGLILLEVDLVQEAGRYYLKIFIYNENHQITHEDCENVTRGLQDSIDQVIDIAYYLEVSSPGLERKIKSPKEYNIFKNKKVEIKLKAQKEERYKKFQAKILEYNSETGLKVEILDNKEIIDIKQNDISSVRLVADFDI